MLLKRQYEEAIRHTEELLKKKPDDPIVYYAIGEALNTVGMFDRCIDILEDSDPTNEIQLGIAYRLKGQSEEAVETLKQVLSSPYLPPWFARQVHLNLTILYAELNRTADARAEATELESIWPNFSVDTWGKRNPMQDRSQVARDMAALRKAGLK